MYVLKVQHSKTWQAQRNLAEFPGLLSVSSYFQILNVFVFVICIQMLNILAAYLEGFKHSLQCSTILREVATPITVITPVS